MIHASDNLLNVLLISHFCTKIGIISTYDIITKNNIERIKTEVISMIRKADLHVTKSLTVNDDYIRLTIDKNSGEITIENIEICHITAYENGKQLTVPFEKIHGIDSAFDIISRWFENELVTPYTVFYVKYNDNKFKVTYAGYDEIGVTIDKIM